MLHTFDRFEPFFYFASFCFRPEQNNFSEACDHNKEKAAHEDMHDLVQASDIIVQGPHGHRKQLKIFEE